MTQRLAVFTPIEVDVDGIRSTGRTAGNGPPVLLLHGYPRYLLRSPQAGLRATGRGMTESPCCP